jgi:4-hydroxy 2-oxovalerate aldolase
MYGMNAINTLDVTLRDGGYRINFRFDSEHIAHILGDLNESGIEYIEIGYKNGSIKHYPNMGDTGICPKEYLLFCQKLITHSKIAVMVHPKNIKLADVQELQECGVGMVRICLVKDSYEQTIPVIEECKTLGMEVSINITRMSRYSEHELDEVVDKISMHPVDVIYFADSNGSMLPEEIQTIYAKYTSKYSILFGFHAHDNLGMAQANSIAAVNNGAKYIDMSLSGMGKGIGNLKSEFFVAYLHAMGIKKYDLDRVRLASNYVRERLDKNPNLIELNDFFMGIADLSIDDIQSKQLMQTA